MDSLSALIVLGGGDGKRLGGASKPDLVIQGRRALEWALISQPNIPHVCVVPETVTVPSDVIRVMEDPPKSGPAAGFLTGVDAVRRILGDACAMPRWIGLLPWTLPLHPCAFLAFSRPWLIWRRRESRWMASVHAPMVTVKISSEFFRSRQ